MTPRNMDRADPVIAQQAASSSDNSAGQGQAQAVQPLSALTSSQRSERARIERLGQQHFDDIKAHEAFEALARQVPLIRMWGAHTHKHTHTHVHTHTRTYTHTQTHTHTHTHTQHRMQDTKRCLQSAAPQTLLLLLLQGAACPVRHGARVCVCVCVRVCVVLCVCAYVVSSCHTNALDANAIHARQPSRRPHRRDGESARATRLHHSAGALPASPRAMQKLLRLLRHSAGAPPTMTTWLKSFSAPPVLLDAARQVRHWPCVCASRLCVLSV